MKKLIYTILFIFIASFAHADSFEFAVMALDTNPQGHGSAPSVAGGITAIRPESATWSDTEERRYLILIVDNLTPAEAMAYSDPWYYDDDMTEAPGGSHRDAMRQTRKYKVNFNLLKARLYHQLDMNQAEDGTTRYQPFLDGDIRLDADNNSHRQIIEFKKP